MRLSDNLENAIKNELNFTAGADLHDRMLDDVLNAQDISKRTVATLPNIRRQKMFDRSRAWKVAAVIAVVIGAGALATTVGLRVRKLHFMGREPDGAYIFQTKPETADEPMRMVLSRLDPNQTVEQKIEDLEEVELLRQQDKRRELLSVSETEVNGKLQPRSFHFKYLLADGREITLNEGDPDTKDLEKSLTENQKEEVLNLLRKMKFEDLDNKEKEVMGRVFVFRRMKFILSDGTEVIKSAGRPEGEWK